MSALRNSSNQFRQSPSVKGMTPSKTLPKINGVSQFMSNERNSKGFGASNSFMPNGKGSKSFVNNEFSRQIRNAQSKADENVEDEYIKNLQQQIAYQELELKLLKEKELEQKASVAQIDKFFNDGIPLNENILAIKNQYKHQKNTAENRIDELNEHRMDEMKLAADLKNNYDRSVAALKTIMDALDKKEREYTDNMNATRMAYLEERNRRAEAEKEYKDLQKELKKLHDHNLQMTRDLERENVIVAHKDESLKAARKKTKDLLEMKEDLIVKIGKEVQLKRAAATDNPEILFLTNENMDLSGKIIRTDKEANMARAKVKEMEMFLESRKREKQLEAAQKRELITKINDIKFEIDEQNKMNEDIIKKKVGEKEDKEKKDLEKEIAEVKTHKTVTKTRIQEKEDALRDLASQKMGVQQDIMALEVEKSHLDKEVREKAEILLKLRTQNEGLGLLENELDEKLVPIVKECNKINALIPQLNKHNDELKEKIAHEEEKNDLDTLFKNINLEELKLLVENNDRVQGTISDLMRKWDQLIRLNMEQQQVAGDMR